jgi:hypothetical protein
MNLSGVKISCLVSEYLSKILKEIYLVEEANKTLYEAFGIVDFFEKQSEIEELKNFFNVSTTHVCEPDRIEYGDFQTNDNLANATTLFLKEQGLLPQVIIEPTCGKGNFIVASLKNFNQIETVFGIEIYKPYVWECKFNIIDFFLNNPNAQKPEIKIYHFNVFDFDFKEVQRKCNNKRLLIIGNPPWVTNAQLGSLNSSNLPRKSNFKKYNGLDAITGKGNFDIAEYITEMLINIFQETTGNLALLVKNSVIKNIMYEQKRNRYKISNIKRYGIDSKKEFNVSVDASLFFFTLHAKPAFDCEAYDFYNSKLNSKQFGWVDDKFVSNTKNYKIIEQFDGKSPFIWRQGIKHDCTKIMELDKLNGHFINKLNEGVELESELVYGFLKSSDLKNTVAAETRKYTIVTQTKIGQETSYIKNRYPKTYDYLIAHKDYFDSRKSSIYNNKPLFSIFGVGEYSFMPYKVAISGLYKTFHFTLILPQDGKPVMLDDTCYFLGFEKLEFAVYTLILLNSPKTIKLLESITFADAKRTFTKETLMRIDIYAILQNINTYELQGILHALNLEYGLNVSLKLWSEYTKKVNPVEQNQLQLFA